MKSWALARRAASTISASRRADPPESDVVADRAAEQEHVLRDEGDFGAQRREVDVGDVLAVDRRPPVAQRIEALDDAEDRRLAAARRADQSRRLVGLGDEIDAVERVLAGAVGEAGVCERDAPLAHVQRRRARPRRLARRRIEHFVDLRRADQAVLEVDRKAAEALGRLVGQQQRAEEGDERADVGVHAR